MLAIGKEDARMGICGDAGMGRWVDERMGRCGDAGYGIGIAHSA